MPYENHSEHSSACPELFPQYETNNIPVFLYSSKLYAPYAGVYIQSLIDHASSENNYDIIILEHDISDENKRLLLSLAKGRNNISIRFSNPIWFLSDLKDDLQYSKMVYSRMLAPYAYVHFDKFITTGVDIILKRDIAELFAVDLGNTVIGAVRDITIPGLYCRNSVLRPSVNTNKIRAQDYIDHVLKLDDPRKYVNADVVVCNAKEFRAEHDLSAVVDMIQKNAFLFLDQDALNVLAKDNLTYISQEWNVMMPLGHGWNQLLASIPEDVKNIYRQACLSPATLHWSGNPKPWVCPDVPYGNEWWDVANRTPFKGHILARMIDELQTRREYYKNRYGQDVVAWDPTPDVDRSKKYL